MRRSLLASLEIVAAFCVAHVAAGGQLPTVHWLLAAGASVFLASWLVIRLRFRMRWMVPALTVTQLWLHLSAPGGVAASGHAGHLHHGDEPALTWPMLAAHLVAAGLTALSWAFRRRLRWVLRLRPPRVPASAIVNRVPEAPSVTFARDLLWVQGGPRRGPPGVLAPAH